MNLNLDNVLGIILAISGIIGYFVRPTADKVSQNLGYKLQGYTVELMKKDPFMVDLASKAFLFAEKEFSQSTKENLFEAATLWFESQVQGPPNVIVRQFLQSVYDDLKIYPRAGSVIDFSTLPHPLESKNIGFIKK